MPQTTVKGQLRALRRQLQESMPISDSRERGEVLDALVDVPAGTWERFGVGRSAVTFAAALARRPDVLGQRLTSLAAEMGRIAAGTSELAAHKRDRRFKDPAWQENPLLRRLLQSYLAGSDTAEGLVEDLDLDWESAQKVQFAVENLVQALSPSNSPLTNPTAIKRAVDTGGVSLLKGARNLVEDLSAPPRIPSMVDTSGFEVGKNQAISPGAVVFRDEVYELIQYQPTTERVSRVPLVIFPPMINKFYAFDMSPGRSLVEFLVAQGIQVFMVSWRNPTAEHRDWGFEVYGQAMLDVLDQIRDLTGSDEEHVMGVCSGGVVTSMVMSHLAKIGELPHVASLTFMVTVLDSGRAGLTTALATQARGRAIKAVSSRKGYLDGRALAEVFAWLRPGDLIWNYWVNNYLLGNTPPAFDLLAWNADVTRMPERLHHDFVDQGLGNTLVQGTQAFRGETVDLAGVTVDTYIVAGITDHLTDWQSCYQTRHMLGGSSRFVLSRSGHIAALVNPPGDPRASFQVADEPAETPEDFLAVAERKEGTWWPDYAEWLKERGNGYQDAPTLGAEGYPLLGPAPGTYVLQR